VSSQPGFNGGSALAANLRAAQACIVTNLAASVGGLTWMLWVNSYFFPIFLLLSISFAQDYRIEKKWSAVGFCSGAIAGLVAITPGSGFVGSRMFRIFFLGNQMLISLFAFWIAAAVLFGFMAGTICNFATQLKFFAGYDDSLDVGPFLFAKKINQFLLIFASNSCCM
jgi:Amt family ammonium transporter